MSLSFLEKTLKAKQKGWQRRHPRFRTDFLVKATVLQESGYTEIQGRCGDIGRGGMGVVLTAEIDKGEVISLTFSLAKTTVAVRSIVRYRKGFLHGLEFLGLSADQQNLIEEFCKDLLPIGYTGG